MSALATNIRAVRDLLAKRESWTKAAYATTCNGFDVDPWSPFAKRWCLVGAIRRVVPLWQRAATANKLARMAGVDRLSDWNDAPGRTHADVLTLLDRALAEVSP